MVLVVEEGAFWDLDFVFVAKSKNQTRDAEKSNHESNNWSSILQVWCYDWVMRANNNGNYTCLISSSLNCANAAFIKIIGVCWCKLLVIET